MGTGDRFCWAFAPYQLRAVGETPSTRRSVMHSTMVIEKKSLVSKKNAPASKPVL
jgi:hypothetical protein